MSKYHFPFPGVPSKSADPKSRAFAYDNAAIVIDNRLRFVIGHHIVSLCNVFVRNQFYVRTCEETFVMNKRQRKVSNEMLLFRCTKALAVAFSCNLCPRRLVSFFELL